MSCPLHKFRSHFQTLRAHNFGGQSAFPKSLAILAHSPEYLAGPVTGCARDELDAVNDAGTVADVAASWNFRSRFHRCLNKKT
jgi:hypothetical protein